jgi:ElaB/YqjD/DUF883 family membrane-anchored ribosome-binding protein
MDDKPIGDQASKIADNLKEGTATAMDKASEWAGRAKNASAATISTIQGAAREASTRVSDLATETYKQGASAGEYVSRSTAEQPLLALLLAAAVGYAIAFLLHRR